MPATPLGEWSPAFPVFRLDDAPGRPQVEALRVKLYARAGLRLVCKIGGRSHAVSAHRASAVQPARIPAAATCRTCGGSADCDGARLAWRLVHAWRPDRDPAPLDNPSTSPG